MTQLILLAHGSPDPRSGEAMRRFGKRIQDAINLPTTVAFLDHEKPSLLDVVKHHHQKDALVVPMLLSNAFHARFDVPKVLRQAGLHRALPPIGNPVSILRHLIEKAGSNVMVVAAGSSDAKARDAFQRAVELASRGLNRNVDISFATGFEQTIESQLNDSKDPSKVTVVPWLLAEGRLLDVVLSHAAQHGATVQGNGLVEESSFLDHLSSTIQLSLQSELHLQPTMAQ